MKKLLIVDDQEMYLMSLRLALKNEYDVYTATNYDDALEVCKKGIDIALIDIRLDENNDDNTDGLEILAWLSKEIPTVKSFIMSAYKEFSYAESALNLGAQYFFRKPISIEEMLEIIKAKS